MRKDEKLIFTRDVVVMEPGLGGAPYQPVNIKKGTEVQSTNLPMQGCVLPGGSIVPGIQVGGVFHYPITVPVDAIKIEL